MPDPSLTIRRAVASDAPLVLAFVKELAEYERDLAAVTATVDDFLRDGFGEHPLFHVLIAERCEGADVRPAGFAFYFFQYTTWKGRPVLYLEDLFVRPEFRGFGVGRLLVQHLASEATRCGCACVKWQVLDWNVDAIAFYARLGAQVLPEWRTVRLDGDAMRSLAESE